MKNFNKKILISIFIFLIVLFLSISIIIANNTNNNMSNESKEKMYYQIKYLDNKMIDVANLLDNSTNNTLANWEELKINTQMIYQYWNSIILDLNTLEIDKNSLTDFGKNLDSLAISIKNKDKQRSLENLIKLYEKLLFYSENVKYNEDYSNLLYSKYYLLISYSIAPKGNWTVMHENILKADNYLSKVVNSMGNNQYSQYNINQAYIAVKEMQNIINLKDLDLFYFKYNTAMRKLNNLTFK